MASRIELEGSQGAIPTTNLYFTLLIKLSVEGRGKFNEIKRGRDRKRLGSLTLHFKDMSEVNL